MKYKAKNATAYYICWGSPLPDIPAILHVPAVEAQEAVYSETEVDEFGGPLLVTPAIEAVAEVEAVEAITGRLAAHIGVLDKGLTVSSGQPNYHVSEDVWELLDYIDDQPILGIELVPETGQVEVGFYMVGGKCVFCKEAHVRQEVLVYETTADRVLVAPPPIIEEVI